MTKLTKATRLELQKQMIRRLKFGESNVVSEIIALGLDLNAEVDFDSPLLAAVTARNMSECTALLDAGADLDVRGKKGITALQTAVGAQDAELVKLLIERGADVHAKDEYGSTALHSAASRGNVLACEILYYSGARINQGDACGYTPLHHAAMGSIGEESLKACQWLLENGASPHPQTKFGDSPLHWAVKGGHLRTCRLLVEAGASPSQPAEPTVSRQSSGPLLTPFQEAVSKGRRDIVHYFVTKCGEDLAQRTVIGRTLAQVAGKNVEMRDFLKSLKTELTVLDASSESDNADGPRRTAREAGVNAL